MRQGATLSFAGDLAEPAQAAFATFLAQQHDHKAAQLGGFVYSNGSVWPHNLLVGLQSQRSNRLYSGYRFSTMVQSPQRGSMMTC